jgi:mRNA interferase RelE/StbE
MNVSINKSFAKDAKTISDSRILSQIAEIIEQVESVKLLSEIKNCKKLKGSINTFRIKCAQYRIGILFDNETVEFVRILHRKDIYKYFPK